MLDEGLATLEREKRRGIYEALEARVFEEAYLIPLHHEDHVAVVSSRASMFTPSADGRWGALASIA